MPPIQPQKPFQGEIYAAPPPLPRPVTWYFLRVAVVECKVEVAEEASAAIRELAWVDGHALAWLARLRRHARKAIGAGVGAAARHGVLRRGQKRREAEEEGEWKAGHGVREKKKIYKGRRGGGHESTCARGSRGVRDKQRRMKTG